MMKEKMMTNGQVAQVAVNALRNLVGKLAPRYWSRFLLPVFHRDLKTRQYTEG
jgi:hypothetical protein